MRHVHLVGPGGVGKTSTGRALARQLGWCFFDLDETFLARLGSIDACIEHSGLVAYARRNVGLYCRERARLPDDAVIALSSGFMLPRVSRPSHGALLDDIADDPLTRLLLPSFEVEPCVAEVVRRQLAKPWLSTDARREEDKIRRRLPLHLSLPCRRIASVGSVEETAGRLLDDLAPALERSISPPDRPRRPAEPLP
ncbi:MAG: shikimate kinase [Acidobacteriota bacterium]